MKNILCLSLIILLSACAGQFKGMEAPNKDEAVIYYYRPWKYVGAALSIDVKENGKFIADLDVNEYKVHKTNAGLKVISTDTISDDVSLPFTAEKGKSYFIKVENDYCFSLLGCTEINLIPEAKALNEIQKCNKVE